MTKAYLQFTRRELFFRIMLLGVPYYLWLYAIGIELSRALPEHQRTHPLVFKVLAGYPLVYIPAFFFCVISEAVSFQFIWPFHLAAMASTFLLFVWVSRTVVQFQKAFNVKSSTTFRLFLAFWYWPIGVWWLQPRLNKYSKLLG